LPMAHVRLGLARDQKTAKAGSFFTGSVGICGTTAAAQGTDHSLNHSLARDACQRYEEKLRVLHSQETQGFRQGRMGGRASDPS